MSGIDVTVLGCSGSYPAPRGGACSGYLVRAGATTLWVDCGNGTLANLQRHADATEIDAVIISHMHPDHAVDIYGLHVLNKYGLQRAGLPVYAPGGTGKTLSELVGGDWGDTFDWCDVDDGDHCDVGEAVVAFSTTDHPPPTVAMEISHGGRRVIYTADTGPGWSVEAFAPGADLVISEATYLDGDERAPIHLSARQAGEMARAARAKQLVLTHLWPTCSTRVASEQGSDGFGAPVVVANVHDKYVI